MFALIQKLDNKILRISSVSVDLSPEKPFYWMECPVDCTIQWTYNGENFLPPPPTPPYIPTAEDNKSTAMGLLQHTDWTAIPDVSDPTKSNPYLSNVNEFNTYRNIVRQYAINPIDGQIDWPELPNEIWV
jgi:hypothetical protein